MSTMRADTTMSRKLFLESGAIATVATGVGMAGKSASAEEGATYEQTVAWDGEYDVIVVGMGFAGMTSAISAAREGASVLIVEKAPRDEAGGNSKVCHQLYGTVNDVDKGMEYFTGLRGAFESTSDEVIRTWVEGMYKLDDYVVGLGADPQQITSWSDCGNITYETEFDDVPGGEAFEGHSVSPKLSDGALFQLNLDFISSHADQIDVWFEAPARRLLQDPESRAIVGVEVETTDADLSVHARNGVVLACGGFECNDEMVESYLGLGGKHLHYGGNYNDGDGIRMATAAGAGLWHMTNYESTGIGGNIQAANMYYVTLNDLTNVPMIIVGPDGTRYVREAMFPREMKHGHVYVAGDWTYPAVVNGSFAVFDQSGVDADDAQDTFDAGVTAGEVVVADTIEELADVIGTEFLVDTVDIYNRYCAEGFDEAFRRAEDTLLPIERGPFYALRLDTRGILNTQGGPKRSKDAEVLDTLGEPIPRLYSAGELGGVTANRYQGGTNVSECLVFGQIAGKNAASEKEPLPSLKFHAVDSTPKFVKGVRNDLIRAD